MRNFIFIVEKKKFKIAIILYSNIVIIFVIYEIDKKFYKLQFDIYKDDKISYFKLF